MQILDRYITTTPVLHDVPDPDEMTDCIHCHQPIINDKGDVLQWDCYVEQDENGLEWSYWHEGCHGRMVN